MYPMWSDLYDVILEPGPLRASGRYESIREVNETSEYTKIVPGLGEPTASDGDPETTQGGEEPGADDGPSSPDAESGTGTGSPPQRDTTYGNDGPLPPTPVYTVLIADEDATQEDYLTPTKLWMSSRL